jgi:hypothetical protein
MTRTTHTVSFVLGLALAAAALLVPAAQAGGSYPDAFERAVVRHAESTPATGSDVVERAVAAHRAALVATPSPGRAFADVVEPATPTASGIDSGSFDVSSALIGGSAMLALVLLVSGGGLLATRHGRGRVALR